MTSRSIETLIKATIPSSALPEISSTCPFCMNQIETGTEKCPRCGVPLKGGISAEKPPSELPVPPPVAPVPPPVAAEPVPEPAAPKPLPDIVAPAPEIVEPVTKPVAPEPPAPVPVVSVPELAEPSQKPLEPESPIPAAVEPAAPVTEAVQEAAEQQPPPTPTEPIPPLAEPVQEIAEQEPPPAPTEPTPPLTEPVHEAAELKPPPAPAEPIPPLTEPVQEVAEQEPPPAPAEPTPALIEPVQKSSEPEPAAPTASSFAPPISEPTPEPPKIEPSAPEIVELVPEPIDQPPPSPAPVEPAPVEVESEPEPAEPEVVSEPSGGTVTMAKPVVGASGRGLVNGRGATNGAGLVNGRGMINGTGLVNGTGMINGTGPGGRAIRARPTRTTFLRKWQFLAVLVAIIVIIPTFIYLSYDRRSVLAVDGDFGEWAHVSKFTMREPAALPEVNVDEWAVKSDANMLYMYLMTASDVVGTSNVDSFYLFVDVDGSEDSGYLVSTLGADYVLELHGWDQNIESAALMRFDSNTDRLNWTSWSSVGSLQVAIDGERMEAMADMPVGITSDSRFLLLAQNNLINQASSVSYVVPEKGGALVIVQEAGAGVNVLTGLVQSAPSVTLARLTLKCEGSSGTIESMTPVVVGAGLVSQIVDVSLSPGETTTVDVVVDASTVPAEGLVSAYIIPEGVSSTFSEVNVIGEPICAYVSTKPTAIHIDGAFGDWAGRISSDTDSQSVPNQNVDITAVGCVNATAYAAFYVSVQGQAFQGSFVPALRGKPSSQGGGGGGPVIPQRKTGEDVLRIFIDSDISNATGALVQRSSKIIGADYLLEINGINGVIVSKSLMSYGSGAWNAVSTAVSAAADSQQIETSVPFESIGWSTSFVAIVETTDWHMHSDWAWTGVIPDPWVIDANGNTYMTSDGSTWNYLGKPTLVSGDRIVDIAMTTDGTDVFLVTNTGRTYYWILASSTSWTTGQTNPIDIANYSEAVSMDFYSKTGAWLLTKNGSYFWLQDAHKSQKDWTFQNTPLVGYSDYIDLEYNSGTMYALRSGPNTALNYSNNGNSFSSVTSPTGSTSNQTQHTFVPMAAGSGDDKLYVLCENGNIRYSSNGGSTWSALGDLPTPTGSNTTKYVSLGIDPDGYMWVVTDTGYTFRSTDTTTFNNFTCTGQSPIGSIVAIYPTNIVVPEFPILTAPILAILAFVVIPRIRRRRSV